MRKTLILTIIALTLATAASADLQNVIVGGQIRIRGDYYAFDKYAPGFQSTASIAAADLNGFQTGDHRLFPFWDTRRKGDKSLAFVEQRTKLNVRADFTDNVSAFIEFDSYDIWGQDFRSNYLTGIDNRAFTGDDVEVYQSYIEAKEMWGTGLRLRIGRQELKLGSGWLVGVNDTASFFRGLSFDAVRATYEMDQFSVDAFWAKLVERSPLEEDGDVDLYGVYGSYKGIENVSLDAYWLFVRDAANHAALDLDGSIDLHTFGLRGAGTMGALDFEAEAAYQIGSVSEPKTWWRPFWWNDNSKENWDAYAGNLEVGYTIDMNYTPRFFLGAAYFSGDRNDDLFDVRWNDHSFNRLFSNWEYSPILDATDLSNVWVGRGGVSVMPTESIKLMLTGAYFSAVDKTRLLPCWVPCSKDSSKELGWEVGVSANYKYTSDLSFEAGYTHLFAGKGLKDLNYVNQNGLALNGVEEDVDYAYFETKLSF